MRHILNEGVMTTQRRSKAKSGSTDASREKRIAALVNERQTEYGRDEIICSIIQAWAEANSVSLRTLDRSERLARFMEVRPAGLLRNELLTSVGTLTLKDVEVAFENLIDAARKRSEGVVYTPNYIIDYLIQRCADKRLSKTLPRLLDPACGGGGFVIRAAPILAKTFGVSLEQVIRESLHGMDISPEAVECAAISLDLFCAEQKLTTPLSHNVFRVGDSLLTSANEISQTFGVPDGGFDLLTTNPPYVKLQNLDDAYRVQLSEAYAEFAQGSYSLAMLFLIAGHRMLSSSGMLGFITQNNLFTSLAGVGVRNYLQKSRCLHSIVDFEHFKVFNNASAYTCLMFLDNDARDSFGYTTCSDPKAQLSQLGDQSFHTINLRSLDKNKWRLTAPHHLRNVNRLETFGTPLGVLADIRVGFATLKDSVFLLNGRSDQESIESGITVPAIKIAEFSSELDLAANARRIIRPYRKNGNRWIPLTPDEIQNKFPNAYSYLEAHKADLEERGKGKKLPTNFYEWGRSQCMEANGPKLLTKTFSKGPQFILDNTASLFCNGYSVKPKVNGDLFGPAIDIHVLQRILNSKVMDYYTRLTSFQIEGGYQCFQKNFIERFSIPEISDAERSEIMALDGEEREHLIAKIFGICYTVIMEVVPSS
jgi:methylase of polypeptide subunit release factors